MTLVADPTDRTYVGVIKDALDRANARLGSHYLRGIVQANGAVILRCQCGIGFANPTDPMPHLCTVRDAEVPPRKK